jgi:hypothetical protein
MLSQPFSHRKATDSSIMLHCRQPARGESGTQGQKSLTLRWCLCLGHCLDVVTIMFCLERQAIVRLWVNVAEKPSGYSIMQCQKLLTLCRPSFLGGSSDIVLSIFAHKGRKYYDYCLMLWHFSVIIQDIRPEIFDALVTLISMMGQGACYLQFYLLWRPILYFWLDATMQPGDWWMGMTINR